MMPQKMFFTALVFAAAFTAGAALAQSNKQAAEIISKSLLEAQGPVETRPTLDPGLFAAVPQIAQTYQIAREMPRELDKQFCYCYCSVNPSFRHKSLLTCYTDGHAAQCGICMREAVETSELTKQGKSPAEIAAYFKAKYVK